MSRLFRKTVVPIWLRGVNRANSFIVSHYGELFPIYIVSEYPKSGGTWLGRMAADCLQIPLPQRYRLPLAMSCVIHNHWPYKPGYRRPFYLYRDGRDIMVSFYFHRMRRIAEQRYAGDHRHKMVYEKLFGKGYDPMDIRRHLARFIEREFSHPRDSRLTWAEHVASWYDPEHRPHVAYLSYEDLLERPHETLKRSVEHVSGAPVEDWRVEMAVEKYSMARQTGRKPGEEDATSFIRKGVAGDWKNHFDREAAEIFRDLAGETLILLGYEADHSWVDRVEAEESRPAPVG